MAVKTDCVEAFYGPIFAVAGIVACYAALTIEADTSFFDLMRTTDWDLQVIEDHLDQIKLTEPLARAGARKRLRKHIAKNGGGGTSSSMKIVHVKIEPSIASHSARQEAMDLKLDDTEVEARALKAGKDQDLINEVIECTSGYAKAMRHCGHDGAALDKAVEGEDPETEIVKGVDGSGEFKIKSMGTKCVADGWKSMDDFYLAMAQMVTRAEADDKMYIVRRLNAITNHVHKLCMGIQLTYVQKLFKSFYKGIPSAVNETLAQTVELEWKNSLFKKSGGASMGQDSEESKLVQSQKDQIRALKTRVEKTEARGPGAGKSIKCHCCKKDGHIAKNCPEACTSCSQADPDTGFWKHVNKETCGCD